MATNDNSPQRRHFGLRHEAIIPFAIALFLVIAGNVFVGLALTGSRGAQPAEASTSVSVDTAIAASGICVAPTEELTTVGRGSDDDGDETAAFTFGFLIFEQAIESSSASAFGPLPACTHFQ